MSKPIMVVGTSSPHRRDFAKNHFGETFELVFLSPDIDERQFRSDDPFALTSMIAHSKMTALREKVAEDVSLTDRILAHSDSVAVTFDQVVHFHKEIREKPESEEEARAFIASYSGAALGTVMTTVLFVFATKRTVSKPNTTLTVYRTIAADAVERIIARGDCFHTAGGFVVEDVDMQQCMVAIEVGTQEDVRGFCAKSVAALLEEVHAV